MEEIKDFIFNNLASDSGPENTKVVEFEAFKRSESLNEQRKEEVRFEEEIAEKKGFKILELAQEQEDRKLQKHQLKEEMIKKEIDQRLKEVEKETYEKAHEEGLKAGKEEITANLHIAAEETLNSLTRLVEDLLAEKEKLFNEQKNQLLFMNKNIIKWIILRELKDDGNYMTSILERLVAELQSQTNLNIQVNKKDFEKMPEVLKLLEDKMGEFKNVRMVIDYDIPEKGIVVDSDNGMIKSTINEQFMAIDSLFEKIGIFDNEFFDETDEN